MSAKYRSPSFLLPNELNTSANTANDTGINSLYSMNFDGTNNIDCGNISALNGATQATWSCWYRKTVNASPYFMGTWGDVANTKQFIAYQYNTGMIVYMGKNTSGSNASHTMFQNTSFGINVNTWYHMAFVFDASESSNADKLKFYLNGTPITNTVAGGALTSLNSVTSSFDIGGPTTLQKFTGNLDEVAIFNRALNSTERAALYDGTGSNIRPSNLMATNLNPLAYYPLGEQAQNSGYPSATGNEWQFPNGVLQDYVMDFDSTSPGDYISAPMTTLNSATQCTISFWGKKDASNKQLNVGGWESDSAGIWVNWYLDGNLYLTPRGTGATSFSVSYAQPYDNNWHHFLGVYDGSSAANCKLYLDGDLVATGSGTAPSSLPATTGDNFQIGALGTSYLSDGQISNVAVWNTAITDANQIANIYNNGSPQTSYTVSPQNWWKLNATSVYTPSAPNYTTALDFDGTSNKITSISNSGFTSNAARTFSAWIKTTDTGNYVTVIQTGPDSTNNNFELGTFGGFLHFSSWATYNFTGNVTISDGNWHFVCITFDGSVINGYVDGNSAGPNLTNASASLATTDTPYYIGGSATGNSAKYFDGSISNVAVYNSALTSSQVSTLFNFGTPETAISFSPQAWWKLNDQTAITDSSGNGNTGTNNGATDISSGVAVVPSWKIPDASGTSNGVSTTLPSTALQQSDLQFDSPYSNYSLSFDGTTGIQCGDIPQLNSATKLSFNVWVNYENMIQRVIFSKEDSTNTIRLYNWTSGVLYFWLKNSGTGTVSYVSNFSSLVNLNEWNMLTVVYDGTQTSNNDRVKIFLNGGNSNILTNYGTIPTSTGNITDSFAIGEYSSGAGNKFLGKLDETAIFNTELTSAQILEIYNNGRPKDLTTFSGTAPINWWRLGENAYFQDSTLVLPNSITGAPNGNAATNNLEMISADAPGTYANGIGTNLDILDRVGDAALSTSNSQSYNMIPSDISPYVPQYVGNQIANNFSMSFDSASNTYFNAGNPTGLQMTGDITVSAWFKTSNSSSALTIVGRGAHYSSSLSSWALFRRSNNGLAVQLRVGNAFVYALSPSTTYNDGNWHHVCFTRKTSSGDLKLYIDGSLSQTTNGVTGVMQNETKETWIGGATDSYYFNGEIDEVAIFNYALNADQIKFDIYEPTKSGTGLTANLDNNPNLTAPVAWYRMGD